MSAPPRPARAIEALLAAALGPTRAASEILGDLHEEFVARSERTGTSPALRAQAWYAVQAGRLAARCAVRRVARRLTRPGALPRPAPPSRDTTMTTMALEFRYAWKSLLKRPATSAIIVATLALGLGSNAVIFAVLDALVLRPFTFPGLDRLAMVAQTAPGYGLGTQETVSPANFLDWRKQADVFERMAAFEWWDVNLAGVDEPERLPGFYVSADFFSVLEVQPALGRAFRPDEEIIGRHRVAILGYDVWQRRFGGDPSVVGRSVLLDAVLHEIVGVAPRGFTFPMGSRIWAPLAMDAKTAALRRDRYLSVIGRLAPGRTLEDAQAQMAVIARRLEEQYPEANRDRGARALSLVEGMKDEGLGPILLLWQASAVFVLLIACANIANLLLARGAERQRELAVRLALGAGRRRLIVQMLAESAMLAVAAVPLAAAVAAAGLHFIRVAMPQRIIRFVSGWEAIGVDYRTLLFTALLALAAAVVFGLLPALQVSSPRIAEALKDGGRGTTPGRQRLRRALAVAEIALALPLLVVAALSTAGVNRVLYGAQGYNPAGVLALRAVLPDAKYAEPEPRRQFVARVSERLAALPGVESAAAINVIPAANNNSSRRVEIEGAPPPDPLNAPLVDYRAASPDFFQTMQIPVVKGRGFTNQDREGAQDVAIVTEALAGRYWPGVDPLGRRLRLGDGPWLTVVGVAGDIVHDWFGRRQYPTVYRPYAQAPTGPVGFVVRTAGDPSPLALAAAHEVRAVDPAQAVFDVMPMRQLLYERTIGLRYVAAIMSAFGIIALVLAVVGVYSVMACLMLQRRHEIGVRMALGADRARVYRLTIGQAGRLASLGAAIGLGLSLLAGRFVEASLFGAISNDLRLQAGLTLVLLSAAMLAGYLPARRAARIDPIVVLRE